MTHAITKPIIGTHNTMTYLKPRKWYGWFMIPFARCQRKTLEGQWADGARCFDLRVRFEQDGTAYFAHGRMALDIDADPYVIIGKLMDKASNENTAIYLRLILEDPQKTNYGAFYFRQFCKAVDDMRSQYKSGNVTLFGGNRKGDWAQIVTFDYVPNLMQYVGSMATDARWYEKIMPFAYAHRRNKANKQNPQGNIAIYDFI